MGILVESSASTTTSPQPGGKKFYDFEDTMNQQYQPPPPVSQPPTTASPTTSSSDLMMGPPPPHLYPLPTSECWPPPPVGPPVTSEPNESNSGVPPLCAGCRLRIEDKFYLSAVDVKWHSACLKCAECGVELETQSSCFEKDGHIYCKDDYRRMYNVNKCSRCHLEIQASDLVMKARQFLFHVDCFRCDTCNTVLKKGDLFGMYEDHLYCRIHYEMASSELATSTTSGGALPVPMGPMTPDHMGHPGHSPHQDSYGVPVHLPFPPPGPPLGYPGGPPGDPWYPTPPDFPPGMGGPGGPGDFQYDNNNEPLLKKRRGRKKRKVETFAAMNGYLEAGGYPPGMEGQGGPGKTKRARTSFKHHQLRIMKHHFQINQNPDSRELKILSQKTQLDKKVLQVWFQNARAKWRRTRAQEPQGPQNPNHPGASATGGSSNSSGMPGTTGTDDSELGMGSPSSDCSGPMIPCC